VPADTSDLNPLDLPLAHAHLHDLQAEVTVVEDLPFVGNMAQPLQDKAGQCLVVPFGQVQLHLFVGFPYSHPSIRLEEVFTDGGKLLSDGFPFLPYRANDDLHELHEGHQSCDATVLVYHDGHLLAFPTQLR